MCKAGRRALAVCRVAAAGELHNSSKVICSHPDKKELQSIKGPLHPKLIFLLPVEVAALHDLLAFPMAWEVEEGKIPGL